MDCKDYTFLRADHWESFSDLKNLFWRGRARTRKTKKSRSRFTPRAKGQFRLARLFWVRKSRVSPVPECAEQGCGISQKRGKCPAQPERQRTGQPGSTPNGSPNSNIKWPGKNPQLFKKTPILQGLFQAQPAHQGKQQIGQDQEFKQKGAV